jgi:hypothetical protein
MELGGVTRASRGDETCWGVFMALCIGLAPLAIWVKPGEGPLDWRFWCCWGCGDDEDMTCWLRPEGVRDGIWRLVRLPGDGSSDGDAAAGAGCGVGVPAGESEGERSELISMMHGVSVRRAGVAVGRGVSTGAKYWDYKASKPSLRTAWDGRKRATLANGGMGRAAGGRM